ncbi:MAG: sulfatase family protein, partial [Candidatus Rokuibacteriota bacterium]
MRSGLPLALGAAALLFASCAHSQDPSPAARRPNVLFVMTDQQRWDSVGANGNRLVKTPNFDRLAAGGVNFTHAFVQAPVCAPSRVSFFTGRYAHAHRNRVNYTPLDRSEVLLQARLKEAGYRTASVGKLHYTPATPEEARRTGFDDVELHDGVAFTDRFSDYVRWRQANDPQKDVPYRSLAKDVVAGKNPYRSAIAAEFTDTAWVGARARRHLRELAAAGRPFFLYASFWKPHAPFEVPEPYASMYDGVEFPLPDRTTEEDLNKLPLPLRKLATRDGKGILEMPRDRLQWMYRSYFGAISHVDAEVGSLLETLRELRLEQDTVVLFSSDHGDQLLEHGIMGKNCFFEASVRVPFMISWPGRVKPGRHDTLVEAVDLLPTLFELAGLPEPRQSQGRSLAPLLADVGRAYVPREAVFSENVIPEVINSGRLDLPFEKGRGVDGVRHPDAKMVRTRRWKYAYYPDGYAELYDLETDPGERANLAGQARVRDVESKMKDRLLHWLTTASEADQ